MIVDAKESIAAHVDATRIAQIVGNLLHNASKHSPSGSEVRVELFRLEDKAVLRVVDEGVGIPSGQLERVFEMFTKIERSMHRTAEGLGVGLALSRQLAELHGGTLAAESDGEEKGAILTLSIPLAGGRPAAKLPEVEAVSAVSRGALDIVLVEDNDDSADIMAHWLEYFGHAVRIARSGEDGVSLALEARPDVVLCDIGLPGIDGGAGVREDRRGDAGAARHGRDDRVGNGQGSHADERRRFQPPPRQAGRSRRAAHGVGVDPRSGRRGGYVLSVWLRKSPLPKRAVPSRR